MVGPTLQRWKDEARRQALLGQRVAKTCRPQCSNWGNFKWRRGLDHYRAGTSGPGRMAYLSLMTYKNRY